MEGPPRFSCCCVYDVCQMKYGHAKSLSTLFDECLCPVIVFYDVCQMKYGHVKSCRHSFMIACVQSFGFMMSARSSMDMSDMHSSNHWACKHCHH